MPKVTVLMSIYNGERFLQGAIESILGQTWTDFEFLIINDGSTDSSREIILSFNDYRIRLADNPQRLGLTKSLNRGLQMSKGELIARQDADDISYPTRLDQEVRFMDGNPEIVLVGTRARAIDERSKPKKIELRIPTGLLAIRWFLMFQNAFIHSSVMFRKNVIWEKLGGYDETFSRAQDYEMWSRVTRAYKVDNLAEILLDYRFEYGSTVSILSQPMPAEEDIGIENLKVFLGCQDVPAQWARIITRLRRKERFVQETNWGKIASMFDQIYSRYCELYPQAKLDRNIRDHLSANLYWLAYYAAPHDRCVSFRSYAKARKLGSKSKKHPSMAKYLALWLTKEGIRRAYHRIR